jgi:hypothetical protein
VLVNGELIVVPPEYTAADLAKAVLEIKGEAFARWREPLREGDQVKMETRFGRCPHRSTKGTPLSVRMRLAKPDSLNSARTRATLVDESAWQANIQLLPMSPGLKCYRSVRSVPFSITRFEGTRATAARGDDEEKGGDNHPIVGSILAPRSAYSSREG